MIVGTGVDITEVNRLRRAVERWGGDFLNRIFSKEELDNAKTRGSLYQHLAGRFAAKEAIFKALNIKSLSWKEIQIFNNADGRPIASVSNKQAKGLDIQISISHVKSYAVASAIVTPKT